MLLKEEIKWRTDSKLEKQTLMDNMDFLENISGAVKMASSDLMEHSPFTCLIHYFFIASKIFVALVIVSNRLNTCRSWISSQLLRKYQKHSGWRYSPEEIWSTLKISNCDRICRNLKPSTENALAHQRALSPSLWLWERRILFWWEKSALLCSIHINQKTKAIISRSSEDQLSHNVNVVLLPLAAHQESFPDVLCPSLLLSDF